jgi:hypothetical protein
MSVTPRRETIRAAELVEELLLDELRLRLHVETGEHQGHRVPEAAEQVDRHLVGRRRGLAARPRDADAVRALLLQDEAVEACCDVGARVARSVDLVAHPQRYEDSDLGRAVDRFVDLAVEPKRLRNLELVQ